MLNISVDTYLLFVTTFALVGVGIIAMCTLIGVVMASRTVKLFPFFKGRSMMLHKWGTISGCMFLLGHVLMTLFTTTRTGITWIDLFIPFRANKETLWLGLGNIALYLMLITIITSLTLMKTNRKIWRWMHYGTYIALFIGLIHGLFISSTFLPDWKLDVFDAEKVVVNLAFIIIVVDIGFRLYHTKKKS